MLGADVDGVDGTEVGCAWPGAVLGFVIVAVGLSFSLNSIELFLIWAERRKL